jgi:hypothetical protein
VNRRLIWFAASGILAAIAPAAQAEQRIYTLAGGWVQGAGISANSTPHLEFPTALSELPDGGVLVADPASHRIVRIARSGDVSVAAGSGDYGFYDGTVTDGRQATDVALNAPAGVAAEPANGFLFTDARCVRHVDGAGLLTTVAGTCAVYGHTGDGGPATLALLGNPTSLLALPDGSYLIADTGNHRVRRVSTDGTISAFAGSGDAGEPTNGQIASNAKLNTPTALALEADGSVLVADSGGASLFATNNRPSRIYRVGPDGRIRTGFANLDTAAGVAALPGGGALVSDAGTGQIIKFSPDGARTVVVGVRRGSDNDLVWPGNGLPATKVALPGGGYNGFGSDAWGPRGLGSVLVEDDGTIIFSEPSSERVRVAAPDGSKWLAVGIPGANATTRRLKVRFMATEPVSVILDVVWNEQTVATGALAKPTTSGTVETDSLLQRGRRYVARLSARASDGRAATDGFVFYPAGRLPFVDAASVADHLAGYLSTPWGGDFERGRCKRMSAARVDCLVRGDYSFFDAILLRADGQVALRYYNARRFSKRPHWGGDAYPPPAWP